MDVEAIIRNHVGENGEIPSTAIGSVVSDIKSAIGKEFVTTERYKAKLSELDAMKTKLQDAEDAVQVAEKWKTKCEESEKALSDYKAEQVAKDTRSAKQKAYKALVKEVGVAEKFRERAMKGVNFDDFELDEEGKLKDSEKIMSGIKKEWGDCVESVKEKGASVPTPPNNTGGSGMTKEEILAIKDTAARQKAMYEHKELFL